MDGYKEYFISGRFSDLAQGLAIAQELKKDNVSLKVDGAPAIVAWNNFRGLPAGVAFKTIFSQLDKGTAEEGKHYFTSKEQILNFMESRRTNFPDEDSFIHRTDAFLQALELTEHLYPEAAFQMDVLWSNRNEVEEDETHIFVKPNPFKYKLNINSLNFSKASSSVLKISFPSNSL